MCLETLINPYRRDEFFREFWERDVLHVERNDSAYFSCLRKDLAVEQVIWQTCHSWGDISLARSNTNYESAPYAALQPTVSTIRKAVADDYTVVINNLEKKSLSVAKFCRDMEKDWYFNSIVNLYYTKGNSQGLNYHYDTEDVFILQLEGIKDWRIYEKRVELPLDTSPYEDLDCDSSAFKTYPLRPGDVLYIPRGFVHEARTRETGSLHLTLTVSVIRWASLLQHLIQVVAQNNVEFRKAIPIDLLKGKDIRAAESAAVALANKIGDNRDLSVAISELQDRLLAQKGRVPTSEGLSGIGAHDIKPESTVGIATDQLYVLAELEDGLLLKFIGASVEVSSDLEEAVRFMCERKTFLVHDLPGELTSAEKLALVRRLTECDFLTAIRC